MRRALLPILILVGVGVSPLPAAAQNEADLAVTKQATPEPVTVGDELAYTIVVTNNGPAEASQVRLTDTLAPEVSFGSARASTGSCQEAGNAVTCDLGTIAFRSSSTVTVVVAPTSPGTLSNTADAQGAGSDPNPTNDSATAQSNVQGSACTVIGTWDADSIAGSVGPDVLCGLGGDDALIGDEGDDVLYGGGGNDVSNGGAGADTENGEKGTDAADYSASSKGVVADLQNGRATGLGSDTLTSIENVIGTSHNDVLRGSSMRNTLDGRKGTDLIFGRANDDVLVGGASADYLKGEDGDDGLRGGDGVDTCYQGPGTGSRSSCLGNRWPDSNDSPGPLDVGRVIVRPSQSTVWRIRTHSRWTPLSIWDHGYFLVLLDTAGSPEPEYHALVRSRRDHLAGLLFRGNKRVASLSVGRPDGHSVTVAIPAGELRFGRGHPWFGWQIETIFDGPSCPPCFDLVADAGSAVQPRR